MIVVFDSGVGGLTVLAEAAQALPREHFLYYADTGNVPYGCRTKQEVAELVNEAVAHIEEDHKVDILLLACNTATSAAAGRLRKISPFPVIVMEPAVKPALEFHPRGDKRVLVLATELTLKEKKFNTLVSQIDARGIVDSVALPGLVELAENKVLGGPEARAYLERSFKGMDMDIYGTVVLGCTHFPYFRHDISLFFPQGTHIIDGNKGTVRQLIRIREKIELKNKPEGIIDYLSSGDITKDKQRFKEILEAYRKML